MGGSTTHVPVALHFEESNLRVTPRAALGIQSQKLLIEHVNELKNEPNNFNSNLFSLSIRGLNSSVLLAQILDRLIPSRPKMQVAVSNLIELWLLMLALHGYWNTGMTAMCGGMKRYTPIPNNKHYRMSFIKKSRPSMYAYINHKFGWTLPSQSCSYIS
jgi:hypothetical protein